MNNQTLCLENINQTRWLRTLSCQDQFFCIESTEYALLTGGYAMRFQNAGEFQDWLSQQQQQGWQVTYQADHQPDPVTNETLIWLQNNIFRTLRLQ